MTGIKRINKLPVTKQMNHRYEVYSVGTGVNNNGMVYDDTWYLESSWGSF